MTTVRPVLLTPAAGNDLDQAFGYVGERNAQAAARLLGELRQAVLRLGEFPELGVALSAEEYEVVAPGVRFVVVEPYAVFYRVGPEAVIVLRVLHTRRGYLAELLGE